MDNSAHGNIGAPPNFSTPPSRGRHFDNADQQLDSMSSSVYGNLSASQNFTTPSRPGRYSGRANQQRQISTSMALVMSDDESQSGTEGADQQVRNAYEQIGSLTTRLSISESSLAREKERNKRYREETHRLKVAEQSLEELLKDKDRRLSEAEATIHAQNEQLDHRRAVFSTLSQSQLQQPSMNITPSTGRMLAGPPPTYNPRRIPARNVGPPSFQRDGSSNFSALAPYDGAPQQHVQISAMTNGFFPYSNVTPPQLQREGSSFTSAMVPFRDAGPLSVPINLGITTHEFEERFKSFFGRVEQWALKFANVADPMRDGKLPDSLVVRLREASSYATASVLLADPSRRYFLIAKYLGSCIVSRCFKLSLMKGFDADADKELAELKKSLEPGTLLEQRRIVVARIAERVTSLVTQPACAEHLLWKADELSRELFAYAQPLLAPDATQPYGEFQSMIRTAAEIGKDMITLPLEWKIDYCAVNIHFKAESMINRDWTITDDPVVMQKNQRRVMMGITPGIVKRDASGISLLASTIQIPQVLLVR
ncbi:MAG: hypothetical protein M1827_001098 [Pycnora praestabilis]|nr:MAG: hypothetical protein M1827_001098 [Pycnora praestabilis]